MINNINLNFERQISFYKKSRFLRVIESPFRIVNSKILELFSKLGKRSIKVWSRTFWGDKMFIVIPEVVSLHIYRYGFFEEGLTRMVLKYLKRGMTFYDIGAHFGYFTLLASYCVGDNGEVHSFEPTLSTYNVLKINACKKKNIKLNNVAIFSKESEILLNDYGFEYSAYNSIYEARLSKEIRKQLNYLQYKTKAISIDQYVETTGSKPDFIKIDAESAEHEILIGMEGTIQKYRPIITIEVGDCGVIGVPKSRELIKYIISKGYAPYEFSNNEIRAHNIKDSYQYDNILFLPHK